MSTPATTCEHHACFPLLAEPQRYAACLWDLSVEAEMLTHWVSVFTNHFPGCLEEAVGEGLDRGESESDLRRRAALAQRGFQAWLDSAADHPDRFEQHNILTFCIERERALRRGGFDDPYRLTKERENRRALELLPGLLDQLDALDPKSRSVALIEGIFAGNIFDLGAVETADLFKDGASLDFHDVQARLAPRPWLVDDLDRWVQRIDTGPASRAAVLFVDNAGPDIVLGMIPFARDLLQRGTHVILTANLTPSLNDITHAELTALIETIAGFDATLRSAVAEGRIELVSSGNGLPLIDLSQLSSQLCQAVRRRDVDLVVIEGMGRALESNFDARFTCDALKLGMIKDGGVARAFGGKLYDLVMRFDGV